MLHARLAVMLESVCELYNQNGVPVALALQLMLTNAYTTRAISSNMKSKSTTIHYLASNLSLADISCFQIFHLLYKSTISLISVQYVKKELMLRTRSF